MTYYNDSGQITIDEVAANRDIRQLQASAQVLRSTQKAFVQLMQQAQDAQGAAAEAIGEKAAEMIVRLNKLVEQMEKTGTTIQCTVNKYQALDRSIAKQIMTQIDGEEILWR